MADITFDDEDGRVRIAITEEKPIGDDNHIVECKCLLTPAEAVQLRAWLDGWLVEHG